MQEHAFARLPLRTNLEHSGDQIHKNYNGWMQNLDRDIRNELRYR